MTVPTLTADELRVWLELQHPVTVLDVRHQTDRDEWFIPGSIHTDAYDALQAGDQDALASLHLPAGIPVVTVCGAGGTSLLAAEQLRARGVDAINLTGGMRAWSLIWNIAEVPLASGDTRILQVRRTGKGCLSYLIASASDACVVDASLDPTLYVQLARDRGWTIRRVLDTHVHADHLSRSRDLARRVGAEQLLPETDRVAYSHTPVSDGMTLQVGAAELRATRTPGHTPESTSYLIDGKVLLTGDTLFPNAVGRPDLDASPQEAGERAHQLYRSLQRLLALPDETMVCAAHAGAPIPFDEVPVGAALAAVRRQVSLLSLDEQAFVAALLARIPATPPNHLRILELNEAGRIPEDDATELEAGANRCAVA
jgi:glyoxylase-like metal-dependent hydrolase (beta-lactamase superfamily II)/rhodanese-related sulfurtransferase